jgi:hypothetical protein
MNSMIPNLPQNQYDSSNFQQILRPPPPLPHMPPEHAFQTPPPTTPPSQGNIIRPNQPNNGVPLLPAPTFFNRPKDQIRFPNQMQHQGQHIPNQFQSNFQQNFQQRPSIGNNPQMRQNFYRTQSMNRINSINNNMPASINQNVQQINNTNENVPLNEPLADKQVKAEPNEAAQSQTQPNGESKLVKNDSSSSLISQQTPSQQPQLIESNLVKHYLDLDENKDETDLIVSTESASFTKSSQEQGENVFDDYLNQQFNPFGYQLDKKLKKTEMPILTKYEQYRKFSKKSDLNEDFGRSYLENDVFKHLFIEDNRNGDVFILNEAEMEFLDDLLNELSRIDKSSRSFKLFDCLFVNNPIYLNNLIDFLVKMLNVDCFSVKIELKAKENEALEDDDGETKVKKLKLEEESDKKLEKDLEKLKLKEKQSMLKQELKWNSLKIRQIKLVFSYVNLLLTKYDESMASRLIDKNIQHKLVDFYENSNENEIVKNESLNLKCLFCLNSSVYFKYGMDKFIEADQNQQNGYNRLVNLFIHSKTSNKKLTSRTTHLISTVISKVAFHESLSLFTFKCHKKFIDRSCKQTESEFADDITKVFQSIYLFIYRSLKLNQSHDLNLNKANLNETKDETNDDSDSSNLDLDEIRQQNGLPLQNLFDSIEIKANSSLTTYNHFLLLLDKFQTFKYILTLWSYLMSNLNGHNLIKFKQLNLLVEKFLSDFTLMNKTVNWSYSGMEYLTNTPRLTNCMLKIMLSPTSNMASDQIGKDMPQSQTKVEFYSKSMLKLAYCLKALDIFDGLVFNLEKLAEKKAADDLLLTFLESVDLVQSLAFFLSHDSKSFDSTTPVNEIMIQFMSGPDGNMSNKYMNCLLNWFEYLIEDVIFEKAIETQNEPNNEAMFNSSRCLMLNSLADIFLTLCRLNKSWSLPIINSNDSNSLNQNLALCMKRLNKLLSSLLNYLVITKLKPVISVNQSYFVLIEKIRSIKSYIEPLVIQFSPTLISNGEDKAASSLVIETNTKMNYFNNLIDLFRINIDKNLNLFFLKHFCWVSVKKSNPNRSTANNETSKVINNLKVNYLNSHITQLVLIQNMVEVHENLLENKLKTFKPNDNEALDSLDLLIAQSNLDLNEKFSKRLYLGKLISRNFWKILLNFLSKLNDYIVFYTIQQQNSSKSLLLNLNQLEQLINLLEPTMYLIKIQIINLIKLREHRFKDASPLEILFKFYGLFNFTIQNSISSLKQNYFDVTSTCSFKKIMFIKSNRSLFKGLIKKFELINKDLMQIFVSFMHTFQTGRPSLKSSLYTSLYRELARYTIDTPFNFVYGLNLLSELLPMPLPILLKQKKELATIDLYDLSAINERKILSDHLEPLFLNEKLNSINLVMDNQDTSSTCHSTFVYLIRIMSQLSSKSKSSALFKRICVQLCDLSDKVCSLVLKTILDYGIELLDRIKFDYDMVEVENEMTNEAKTQSDKVDANNDNDDSIYDTKSLYDENIDENSSLKIEDDNKVLFELNDSNQGAKENEMADLNESSLSKQSSMDIDNVKTEINKPNLVLDVVEQTDFKGNMIQNFTRLIRFLSGLICIEFKHAKVNPIQVQFYNLVNDSTGGESNKKKSYSHFIYDCVKYCNQLDLVNNKSASSDAVTPKPTSFPNLAQGCLIQEAIFHLVETIIKNMPSLFVNNFKIEDFLNDDAIKSLDSNTEPAENRRFTFDFTISMLLKTLFDHLNLNKLDSQAAANQHAIKCLILMNKLNAIYFHSNRLLFDSKHTEANLITFPLVKQHLKPAYSNSLVNYINELLNLFKKQAASSAKIIDELTKFFIYIDSLIDNLNLLSNYNEEKSLLVRLKELLKWSITNTNELLIDSITTSSSLSANNHQHSLINLDKMIESLQSSMSKEDARLNKKYKFCLNQSKCLIKLLNDSDVLSSILLNTNLNEIENGLSINELIEMPSPEAFESFFLEREAYLCIGSQEELSRFELEWTDSSYVLEPTLNASTLNTFNAEDVEMSVETLPKSTLSSSLIADKDLVKQLTASFENHQQQLIQQSQQSSMSQEDLLSEQLSKGGDKAGEQLDQKPGLLKTKSQEVINTRTGNKYKAPMRGGHNNSIGRGLNQANNSQMNPASATPGLMNPPAAPAINRHDPFRTRPPNTSRPPSVHVDDYYRMESANAQAQKQLQTQQNNSTLIQIETTANNSNLIGINTNDSSTKMGEQMTSFTSNASFTRQMMLPNSNSSNNFIENESNKMSAQSDPLVPINTMSMSDKANSGEHHLIMESQLNTNSEMFMSLSPLQQQQQPQSAQQQQAQIINMQSMVWPQQQPQQQRFPRPIQSQMQRNNSMNQNKTFVQINNKMGEDQMMQQQQQQFEVGNNYSNQDGMSMMQQVQQQQQQPPMSPNSAIQIQFQMQQGPNQSLPLLNQNQMFQSPPHQNQMNHQQSIRFQGHVRGGQG